MKIFMILIAALFPFLHNTPYEVQISDCQKNQIIAESQGSKLNLSLFNIHLKNENAWKKTCSILMEADGESRNKNNTDDGKTNDRKKT